MSPQTIKYTISARSAARNERPRSEVLRRPVFAFVAVSCPDANKDAKTLTRASQLRVCTSHCLRYSKTVNQRAATIAICAEIVRLFIVVTVSRCDGLLYERRPHISTHSSAAAGISAPAEKCVFSESHTHTHGAYVKLLDRDKRSRTRSINSTVHARRTRSLCVCRHLIMNTREMCASVMSRFAAHETTHTRRCVAVRIRTAHRCLATCDA